MSDKKYFNAVSVSLIGNMGDEAVITEKEGKTYASFSLATTDSYQDDNLEWQNKEPVWHQVFSSNPKVVSLMKAFKKGTRIQVKGDLFYKPFTAVLEDGRQVQKNTASIAAYFIEPKPLAATGKPSSEEHQSSPQP